MSPVQRSLDWFLREAYEFTVCAAVAVVAVSVISGLAYGIGDVVVTICR